MNEWMFKNTQAQSVWERESDLGVCVWESE